MTSHLEEEAQGLNAGESRQLKTLRVACGARVAPGHLEGHGCPIGACTCFWALTQDRRCFWTVAMDGWQVQFKPLMAPVARTSFGTVSWTMVLEWCPALGENWECAHVHGL